MGRETDLGIGATLGGLGADSGKIPGFERFGMVAEADRLVEGATTGVVVWGRAMEAFEREGPNCAATKADLSINFLNSYLSMRCQKQIQ